MSIRTDLGIDRRVVVSEEIPLPRETVQGLCEVIRSAFKGPDKPVRILYTKGEALVVERTVTEKKAKAEDQFLTPWEMVRQHADVEIREVAEDPLRMMCQATTSLVDKGFVPTMLVASNRAEVDSWFGADVKLDAVLRLPFLEDADCPPHSILFCGSKTGEMVQHIEHAVLCRMRDG
jgi:hypothetical protein